MIVKINQSILVSRGVTLIELLVVMSVLAILLGVGVPSFSQFATNNRLNNYVNSLFSNFALARSEAIKRSNRVVVCKSSDGSACVGGGDWSQGWLIFVDLDNDGSRNGGDEIIHVAPALSAGYSFSGNGNVSNYVSYDSQGMTRLAGGASQAGTFTICPPAPAIGGNGRQMILSGSGRARIIKITSCS